MRPDAKALTAEEAELVGELFRIVGADGFSVGDGAEDSPVFFSGFWERCEKESKRSTATCLTKDQTAYKQTTDGTWLEGA